MDSAEAAETAGNVPPRRHTRILLAVIAIIAVAGGLFVASALSPYGFTDCQAVRKMLEFNQNNTKSQSAWNTSPPTPRSTR